jgi:hypothetical protein
MACRHVVDGHGQHPGCILRRPRSREQRQQQGPAPCVSAGQQADPPPPSACLAQLAAPAIARGGPHPAAAVVVLSRLLPASCLLPTLELLLLLRRRATAAAPHVPQPRPQGGQTKALQRGQQAGSFSSSAGMQASSRQAGLLARCCTPRSSPRARQLAHTARRGACRRSPTGTCPDADASPLPWRPAPQAGQASVPQGDPAGREGALEGVEVVGAVADSAGKVGLVCGCLSRWG